MGKAVLPPSVKAGIPKLSGIPNDWRVYRFGELLKEVSRPISLNDDDEYQLVVAKRSRGGIEARERLTGRQILTKSQFKIEAGDFLISNRQIVHGACGIVPKQLDGSVVSGEYTVLHPNDELDIQFLSHLTHTTYFQQCCFYSSVGVDVEKMIFRIEEWFKLEIAVPPLAEQRKIAQILSCWDRASDEVSQLFRMYELQKASLMQNVLLGKGATLPKGWRKCAIGSVTDVVSGSTPSRANPAYFTSTKDGVPWVKTTDLNNSRIINTSERLTKQAEAEVGVNVRPVGTVLVAMYGGFNQIGRTGILEIEAATNQALACILPSPALYPPYLLHYLNFNVKEWRNFAASSRKDPNITKSDVLNFPIVIPSIEEQRKIAEMFSCWDRAAEVVGGMLTSFKTQKLGLAQQLLSGKVRAKV